MLLQVGCQPSELVVQRADMRVITGVPVAQLIRLDVPP